MAKLPLESVAGDFRERTGQLHAGGACPDDEEREPFHLLGRIGRSLGALERRENARPDAKGVLQRLQAGRVWRPLIVTEVRMRASRRDDQEVVGTGDSIDVDGLALDVYPPRLAEEHGRVALAAQNVPQRGGDGGRGEACGRHLVEQRLKRMVIVAIDQQDVHRCGAEGVRGGEPAEAAADDDYPGLGMHCGGRSPAKKSLGRNLTAIR